MQQYAGIVRAALGIDDARGDKVEIINLRFAGAPVVDGEGGLGSELFGFDPSQLQRLVEIVVLAVVGVLIILLVVRPLIARVLEVTPQAMASAANAPPPGMEGMPPMLPSEGAPPPMPGNMAALAAPGAPGAAGAEGMMMATGGQPEESLSISARSKAVYAHLRSTKSAKLSKSIQTKRFRLFATGCTRNSRPEIYGKCAYATIIEA